jgi:hypothetical protein
MATPQEIAVCVSKLAKTYGLGHMWVERMQSAYIETLREQPEEAIRAACKAWVAKGNEKAPNAVQIANLCREQRTETAAASPGCGRCASGWVVCAVHRPGHDVLPVACRCTCDAGGLHAGALTMAQLRERAERLGNRVVIDPGPGAGGLMPVGWKRGMSARSIERDERRDEWEGEEAS